MTRLRLIATVLALGFAARVWGFVTAGPLWLDEFFIAQNLKALSFTELLGPLLDGQNAPVGWLWLEKALWQWRGASEAWLRTPALVASLLSLPLTYAVARRAVNARFVWLPVTLVACSPFAVWQSFQVKPYASDLLISLLLLLLGQRAGGGRRLDWIWLAAAGAAAVWFSLPSIFVLAGVGAVLTVDVFVRRDGARIAACGAVGAAWLLSFGVHYFFFLRPRPQPEWLYAFWSSGLMAWPPERWDLFWWPRIVVQSCADPAGFGVLAPIAAVLLIAGLVLALRGNGRSPTRLGLWIAGAPMLFAWLASALRLYPFSSRLILFLLPSLGIAIAAGVARTLAMWPTGRRVIHVATAALVAAPVTLFVLWLPDGGLPITADSREIFKDLAAEHASASALSEQEPVVLGHLATYAWRFYATPVDAEIHAAPDAWLDADRVAALAETVNALDSPAVWVVLTRVRTHDPGPWTYGSFLQSQRTWPPADEFRAALDEGWRVDVERRRQGAVLWRLVRTDP